MVIAVRIMSYFGCDRCNDHRGTEDTELLDIRDVVRESWVKNKLLVVI